MWQKCPICNGEGSITKLIPYDGRSTVVSSPISSVCPVCKGQRIISELNGLPPRVGIKDDKSKSIEDLVNKELTDSLFNIAKDQQHESTTD